MTYFSENRTIVSIFTLQIGFRILQMISLFLRKTKVSFNFIQNPKTNLVTVYMRIPYDKNKQL